MTYRGGMWLVIIVSVAVLINGCQDTRLATTPTPALTTLDLITTSTTYPLAYALRQSYVRRDTFFIISLTETNWRGVEQQIQADPAQYGMTTFLPEDSNLWAAAIGEDGIAIIAHRNLSIPVLTASQLRSIFTGNTANWLEVGGPDLPITVVSNDADSDTRLAFERLVLGEREITPGARLAPTSVSMLDIVTTTPGAIGYVSFGLVDRRVRVIPVAAAAGDAPLTPTLATIADQSYPLRTPLLVVGQQAPPPNSAIYQFFVWMQQGSGQRIIAQDYVPLREE